MVVDRILSDVWEGNCRLGKMFIRKDFSNVVKTNTFLECFDTEGFDFGFGSTGLINWSDQRDGVRRNTLYHVRNSKVCSMQCTIKCSGMVMRVYKMNWGGCV